MYTQKMKNKNPITIVVEFRCSGTESSSWYLVTPVLPLVEDYSRVGRRIYITNGCRLQTINPYTPRSEIRQGSLDVDRCYSFPMHIKNVAKSIKEIIAKGGNLFFKTNLSFPCLKVKYRYQLFFVSSSLQLKRRSFKLNFQSNT